MRKIILSCFVSVLMLGCKTITRNQLPLSGTPARVTYEQSINTDVSKDINYDNLIRQVYLLCPETKNVLEDKPNGYFQVISYTKYKYKGDERKLSYLLTATLKDSKCDLKINGIHIMHYPIERIYNNNKRSNVKKFNSSYEDINKGLLAIMDSLKSKIQ
ncbi:MAG TPA: hypothetical protein VF868_06165 [Bacteroidia bacterium]|jgi:hypothetical protein